MRTRLRLAAAIVSVAAALVPLTALAHALPQTETPAAGSEVQQAPASVSIVFGEVPDPQLSAITVINSSGSSVTAGPTVAVSGTPAELEVPLQHGLPDGVYTVTWRTVSTVDGHLATGSYAFGVGVSAANANAHATASVQSPPPTPLQIIAKALLYAGVMLALGVAAMCLVALRDIPHYARRLTGLAAGLVVLGTVGVLESQREAANVGIAHFFATSLGPQAAWRLAVAAVVVIAGIVVLLSDRARTDRGALAVCGAAAAGAMWVDVQYSHAGAQAPLWANLLTQLVHIAAGGIWIGGLVVLVVALRDAHEGERWTVVRRFSAVFAVCIVLVGLTGVFRAVIEIGSWGQLVGSAFGVLVLVKSALFVVLAALGAVNRWVHIPQSPRLLHRLRRFARTEVLVGTAAVVVAAAVVNVAPPVSGGILQASAQSQPQAVTVTASDYATTVTMSLTVAPGVAGFNTFTAHLDGYGTGNPVNASAIQLQLRNPLRPDIAPSNLTLSRQAPGVYSARGPQLSLNGIWQIAAIVENGASSTQVNLQLVTDEPEPQVTKTQFAIGNTVQTVYTVQAAGGDLAQVYLQTLSGTVEFHVTMLAPGGNNELQTSAVTVGETPAHGTPTLLAVRRLDPVGHWVADAQKAAGATRFDIIATLPSGQVIATHLTIENP